MPLLHRYRVQREGSTKGQMEREKPDKRCSDAFQSFSERNQTDLAQDEWPFPPWKTCCLDGSFRYLKPIDFNPSHRLYKKGAGKSTFLNLLSRRLKGGSISGEVLVNGHEISKKKFNSISAYVMQDDALLGNLTPREILRFSARLRMPRSMSRKEKYRHVDKVIDRMNLTRCADSVIGHPGLKRGISGGERKRTSIALELLTSPMLIFLDEPTSGLDSATAFALLQHLKDLAAEGRTVICTIHQPSSEMMMLFDDVFWLSAGHLLYSGPLNLLNVYFSDAGFACPTFANPADYVMSVVSKDEFETQDVLDSRLAQLVEYHATHNNIISAEEHAKEEGMDITAKPLVAKGGEFWHWKFWVVFVRSFKQRLRDPGNTYMRVAQNLIVPIFAGLLFLQLGHDQNGTILPSSQSLFLTMSAFPINRSNSG